jgi:thioredoxin-related protein
VRQWLFAIAVNMALALAWPVFAAPDIGYDPHADAFADLAAASARAAAEGKLVLVIAGGDWCVWCHYLHAFIERNSEVERALHDVFVIDQVYVGDENRNSRFFSQWPQAAGAPHFWILSPDGKLLESQPTVVLEDGNKSYDKAKFLAFIEHWRKRV